VLKIRCTTTLPQVCATFLSPLQGLFPKFTFTQGLRPGLHSVAASRLVDCVPDRLGEDVTDVTMHGQIFPYSRSGEAERSTNLQPRSVSKSPE
jgi:hypothetical protein